MNPRHSAKADTYILAWKRILHEKQLNKITMQRKLRQKYLIYRNRLTNFDQFPRVGQA